MLFDLDGGEEALPPEKLAPGQFPSSLTVEFTGGASIPAGLRAGTATLRRQGDRWVVLQSQTPGGQTEVSITDQQAGALLDRRHCREIAPGEMNKMRSALNNGREIFVRVGRTCWFIRFVRQQNVYEARQLSGQEGLQSIEEARISHWLQQPIAFF